MKHIRVSGCFWKWCICVSISFRYRYTFPYSCCLSLLNGLPSVQNLMLRVWRTHLEVIPLKILEINICLKWPGHWHLFSYLFQKQWLWDNPLKFRYLKNLQLLIIIPQYEDNVLYLVSFLRATPFFENLELHASVT